MQDFLSRFIFQLFFASPKHFAQLFLKVVLDIQAHRIARRLLAPATALRHIAITLQVLQITNAYGAAVILRLGLCLFLDVNRLRL